MNLVRAELSRLFSRRFVQVMLALLVIAFGITIFTVMASSDVPGDVAWARAEEMADQERRNMIEYRNTCLLANEPDAPQDLQEKFYGVDCKQFDPANVKVEHFIYGAFVFSQSIVPLIGFLAAYLCFFGFLVSASFIGAELHSGGMTNLLLWRPQRLKVLGTKLGVLIASLAGIFIVFAAVYVTTFWALAETTGWVGDLKPGFWNDLAGMTLKAIGLALVASVVAFALATIGRHTAAALGTLVGYFVVWEGGARIVMNAVDFRENEVYFLSTHAYALMSGEYWIHRWDCNWEALNSNCEWILYWWQSGLVFLAIGAVITAAAFAIFRRRDMM